METVADPAKRYDRPAVTYGELMGLPEPGHLVLRSLSRESLVLSEVRYDRPDFGLTPSSLPQPSIAIGFTLRHHPKHEIWLGGKNHVVRAVAVGETLFYDMSQSMSGHTLHPFHSIMLTLPWAILRAVADEISGVEIDGSYFSAYARLNDPVLEWMGRIARRLVSRGHEVDMLLAEHFLMSVATYLCARYVGYPRNRRLHGGLSAWQEKAAKEMIEAHLDSGISLAALAALCGVGISQFAHAFKQSVGMAPYQWLQCCRVERAKALLSRTDSLVDVAGACGFSDQSHFTRVFRRLTGSSPGRWRAPDLKHDDGSRYAGGDWRHAGPTMPATP